MELSGATLVVDVKVDHKQWNLYYENENTWESCESCRRYLQLTHKCECQKVSYCSEACKTKDFLYHSDRCEKVTEDTEEVQITLNDNSK